MIYHNPVTKSELERGGLEVTVLAYSDSTSASGCPEPSSAHPASRPQTSLLLYHELQPEKNISYSARMYSPELKGNDAPRIVSANAQPPPPSQKFCLNYTPRVSFQSPAHCLCNVGKGNTYFIVMLGKRGPRSRCLAPQLLISSKL